MSVFSFIQNWANGIVQNATDKFNDIVAALETQRQTEIAKLGNDVKAIEAVQQKTQEAIQTNKAILLKTISGIKSGIQPSSSWTQDDITALGIIFVILMTSKGKEVYKTIEPLLHDIIQMDSHALTAMFQAASTHPALAMPGILLFTSINERLLLIDHASAMNAYGITAGLMDASQIVDMFKEGVTSIGFSSPRFLPSGASQPRSAIRSSSAGSGKEVSEGESGHTRGSS